MRHPATVLIVACMLSVALLASCAQQSWTAQDVDALAQRYASTQIEEWGLARGSPREKKLRDLAAKALSDEAVVAAARVKPSAESWDDWGERLSNEGMLFLDGDSLLKFFSAKARLFNDASDTECAAGAKLLVPTEASGPLLTALTKSGTKADNGQLRAVWRQRLARVPEDDFDTLTQIPTSAALTRAKRIAEPLPPMTTSERARVMRVLEAYIARGLSAQEQRDLLNVAESGDPTAMCKLVRLLTTAQSRLPNTDAAFGLRVFLPSE